MACTVRRSGEGGHAINIVVGGAACLPKTKRVADKELWDVFLKMKQQKK